jgi:hypothetical protein
MQRYLVFRVVSDGSGAASCGMVVVGVPAGGAARGGWWQLHSAGTVPPSCTALRPREPGQPAKRGGVHANNEPMIRGFWRTHVYLRAQNGGGRT